MKKIITNIKQIALAILLFTGAAACNKEAEVTKAISIQIRGYNAGNSELEISVDTLVYRNATIASDKEIDFGYVYTYPSSKDGATLRIKDNVSGKDVYQQQLPLNTSDLERFFQFVFINGQQLEVKPPAADQSTNKIGFYIHYPASNDLIDVFLQNSEGQIAYLAKNVQPGTWVYTDFAGDANFNNPNTNYDIYFTKAGTVDTWAFNDNQYMSLAHSSSMFLPKFGATGRVCSYFVTPGTVDLRTVPLFQAPK